MQHVNNDAMAHFILTLFICIWEELPNTGILKVTSLPVPSSCNITLFAQESEMTVEIFFIFVFFPHKATGIMRNMCLCVFAGAG